MISKTSVVSLLLQLRSSAVAAIVVFGHLGNIDAHSFLVENLQSSSMLLLVPTDLLMHA